MRTLVNMSVRFGGEDGKYVPTSLPPAHQLDMHVDGTELLWRIEEARKELKAELSRKGAQESREGVDSFQRRLRKSTTPDSLTFASCQISALSANRRHWDKRLVAIDQELAKEPERIRDVYKVKAQQIEPVGLVYLWPMSS